MRFAALFGVLMVTMAGTAFADPPALKLTNLNFGSEKAGTQAVGTITATNRSSQPVPIDGETLAVTGAVGSLAFGPPDTCYPLAAGGGLPLMPGESCTAQIRVDVELGSFFGEFCLAQLYCERFRGHGIE